jgi:hypothetical protein
LALASWIGVRRKKIDDELDTAYEENGAAPFTKGEEK